MRTSLYAGRCASLRQPPTSEGAMAEALRASGVRPARCLVCILKTLRNDVRRDGMTRRCCRRQRRQRVSMTRAERSGLVIMLTCLGSVTNLCSATSRRVGPAFLAPALVSSDCLRGDRLGAAVQRPQSDQTRPSSGPRLRVLERRRWRRLRCRRVTCRQRTCPDSPASR